MRPEQSSRGEKGGGAGKRDRGGWILGWGKNARNGQVRESPQSGGPSGAHVTGLCPGVHHPFPLQTRERIPFPLHNPTQALGEAVSPAALGRPVWEGGMELEASTAAAESDAACWMVCPCPAGLQRAGMLFEPCHVAGTARADSSTGPLPLH